VKHTFSFHVDSHHSAAAAAADITVNSLLGNKSDRTVDRFDTVAVHIDDETACFSVGCGSYVT